VDKFNKKILMEIKEKAEERCNMGEEERVALINYIDFLTSKEPNPEKFEEVLLRQQIYSFTNFEFIPGIDQPTNTDKLWLQYIHGGHIKGYITFKVNGKNF
jgi:hypothetical protein